MMQPPKDYEGILIKKERMTEHIGLYTIKIEDASFSFIPGQFMMISMTAERGLARAFSICSGPEEKNELEFCMKINYPSVLSEKLEQTPLNAKVHLRGAFGLFQLKQTKKEIVLLAGGTGIAPLRSMLHELMRQKAQQPIWLFYRFKTEEEYLFQKELEQIAASLKNMRLIPSVSTPSPSWKGETERVQNIIAKYIKDPKQTECYICGPPPMVKDLVEALPALGFPLESIHKEAW